MTQDDFPQELLDAANRLRDSVNLHVVASQYGERKIGYVAINLKDGRAYQNTLFDSRKDAARHTLNNPDGHFYVKVGVEAMSEREAIIVLQMARQAHSKGVVFADEEPIVPMLSELAMPYIPRTLGRLDNGLILPNRRNSR